MVEEYVKYISPLNFLFERLIALNFREDLLSKPVLDELEKEITAANQEFNHRFMESQDRPLSTADFLSSVYQPYREKHPHKSVYIIIFDGMRWDAWEYLLPVIKKALIGHKLAEVVPLEALRPTTTPVNRKALLGGVNEEEEGQILGEDYLFLTAAERGYRREEVADFFQQEVSVKIINFNLIDDRLHRAGTDLYSLYQGLSLDFKTSVAPYFKELAGHLLFILSDHGFIYNRQSSQPYTHGGQSAFESIVPASIWLPE